MSGLLSKMTTMTELRALFVGNSLLIAGAFAAMWGLVLSLAGLAAVGLVVFTLSLVILVRAFIRYQWPDLKRYAKWVQEEVNGRQNRNR